MRWLSLASLLALSACAASASTAPARLVLPDSPTTRSSADDEAPSESPLDPQRSRSFRRAQLACDRGELDACASLAEHFAFGIGVAADNQHAYEIIRPLCERRAPRACVVFASIFVYSALTDTAADARSIAERECSSGSFDACVTLADARSLALGGALELDRVEPALRPACAAGHRSSCAALALFLAERRPSSRAEAASLARVECARAEPRACVAQALLSSDPSASIALLDRACSLGFARACSLAATRFVLGDGVERDPERAERLLQRGCFHSIPPAGCAQWIELDPARRSPATEPMLLERACRYERDLAVCDRFVRSMLSLGQDRFDSLLPLRAWLVPACDHGDARVCATIAAIDSRFEGIETDRAAIAPLRAACALDDAFACGRLADVLERSGAEAEAAALFARACARGDARSCHSLVFGALAVEVALDPSSSTAQRRRVHQWASLGCAFGSGACCLFALRTAAGEAERIAAVRAACAHGLTSLCGR
ncbi:MAG: hypothetical protein U0269_18050 [Polyangiales bacterium]